MALNKTVKTANFTVENQRNKAIMEKLPKKTKKGVSYIDNKST